VQASSIICEQSLDSVRARPRGAAVVSIATQEEISHWARVLPKMLFAKYCNYDSSCRVSALRIVIR
jgi:hypothetical protein